MTKPKTPTPSSSADSSARAATANPPASDNNIIDVDYSPSDEEESTTPQYGVESDRTDDILRYGVVMTEEDDDGVFLPQKYNLTKEQKEALKKTEKQITVSRIDKEKLVVYRAQGRPLSWIAKKFGVSSAAVSKSLSTLKASAGMPMEIKDFKEARADVLALIQKNLLEGITKEAISKMSIKDRIWGAATLFDKERIERGQSTQNTAVIFNIISEACKPEVK